MALKLQNLDHLQRIVTEKGIPTQYFIRFIQDRGGAVTDIDALLTLLEEAINDLDDIDIIAGTALDGGGNLGAGVDITIDHSNSAVTPGSYTRANITVDAQGHVTAAANGSAGSGAWTVAATNTVSSPVAQVDFTGLTFTDAMIVARSVTFSTANNFIGARASVNNGSTFFSTSGDYVSISAANGGSTNSTELGSMQQSVTTNSPKAGMMLIQGNGLASPPTVDELIQRDKRFFVGSASAINALRVYPGSGGNFTAGSFWVLVR